MPKTSRMLVCKLASLSIALVIGFLFLTPVANAQQYDSNLYSGLRWRLIGPFRGGRINAVSGVPGQPETFYYGSVGGGVWKTNNAGRTWNPVFDSANVGSIGAIGVGGMSTSAGATKAGRSSVALRYSSATTRSRCRSSRRTTRSSGTSMARQSGWPVTPSSRSASTHLIRLRSR